jgi:deazaflavin-dependent oxidoreductase (nitroreductase family)
MTGVLVRLVLAVVAGLLGLGAVFLIGMRRKSPAVLDAVRRFNKSINNPKQMTNAGTPGAYASVIEHTGRTSGTIYRTPVGTESIDGGFLIALPYGTRPDWVKNVLAAGSAIITAEGETVAVDQPEIVATAGVAEHFDGVELRVMGLFNVEQCMQVRRSDQQG